MTRGPFGYQRKYDPARDCGPQNHRWHVPIRKGERWAYCGKCGKRRGKDRKPRKRD